MEKESLFCGYPTKDISRAKVFPTEAQKLQTRGYLAREQKVEGVKNVIGGEEYRSRERDPEHPSYKTLYSLESLHHMLNFRSDSDVLILRVFQEQLPTSQLSLLPAAHPTPRAGQLGIGFVEYKLKYWVKNAFERGRFNYAYQIFAVKVNN